MNDNDFREFIIYAARELTLDKSAAMKTATKEYLEALHALRELNKKMLYRGTMRADK